MKFYGFPRQDGTVGTRNLVAVIPSVSCANHVAQRIAANVQGAVAFPHALGCGFPGADQALASHMLRRVALHPNFGAVLFVGLGCERLLCEDLLSGLNLSGKFVDSFTIQGEGDSLKAMAKGTRIAQEWAYRLGAQRREPVDAKHIVLGLKCGGTDSASGIAANPVLGAASDMLIAEGGTSIITEVTELIGAEHIMARHAETPEVAAAILKLVKTNAERLKRDIGSSDASHNAHLLVSPGNLDGGVTNVVEKALGGLKKAGNAPFKGVLGYAEPPKGKGLYLMDGPGYDGEAVSGVIGAGANVVVFTTGRGTPTGYPGVPVIKSTGNPELWSRMSANLDFDAAEIIRDRKNISEVGKKLFQMILDVASGQPVKAELIGHEELFMISRMIGRHRYIESLCPLEM